MQGQAIIRAGGHFMSFSDTCRAEVGVGVGVGVGGSS